MGLKALHRLLWAGVWVALRLRCQMPFPSCLLAFLGGHRKLRTHHAGLVAMGIEQSVWVAVRTTGKGSWKTAANPPSPRISLVAGPRHSCYELYGCVNATERCLQNPALG